MKRFLKITATVVAVVLVVAIVTPLLLRGKIGDIVKREANAMLAARLDFEKLDISLLRNFPNASLNLKGLTLVGTDRFEGDTIVAARRITVVVNLMSLVGDEGFEVRKIILASPALHAHKLADGAVNWDVMKPSEPADTTAAEESAPSSFRLSVRDFRLTDAVIRYEDDSTGMELRTAPLSLRLSGDMSAESTQLDLDLLAGGVDFTQGGVPLLHDAELALDAEIDADLAEGRFTFSRNTLRLNAIEMRLDGWVQQVGDALAMDVSAGCSEVRFKDLLSLIPAFYKHEFRSLAASGELSMELWARGQMHGAQLPAFELKTEVHNGSFQYSSLPKAVTDINIAAKVSNAGGELDKTEVEISEFGLKMAGNSLSATGYATNLMSDPTFRATLSGRVDLGAIREVYPLERGIDLAGRIAASMKLSGRMSDVESGRYERISASGSLVVEQLGLHVPQLPEVFIRRAAATISPQAMTLGEFGVKVGGSDLSATGQLTGYLGYLMRGEQLAGRLYVKSDLLDLNEIRAAVPADAEAESADAEKPAEEAAAAPAQAIVVPKNLNLSLNAELKKVLFEKMVITDIAGEMSVAGGTLSLDRLGLQLFGGKASASGRYSTAADPAHPTLSLAASIAKASFPRTFEEIEAVRQLAPIFEKASGDYSLSIDMRTTLDAAMSPDLMSLTAQGEISSENVSVEGVEVFDKLADLLKNDKLRRIEARDLKIRFSIKDGRVTTEPFDLKMGDVNVNMSGTTGLDRTIDYTAKVTLPAGVGGVLGAVNVGIGGTFTSPKITLGVQETVEQVVSNVVSEQIDNLTGGRGGLLSDDTQTRAAALREEAQRAGEKLVEAAETQRQKLVDAAAKKGALAKIAAEAAGDALVDEAKKQSKALLEEAEKQIQKLTQEAESGAQQ
ncbi:AsmA-like C-terminal region-containing protein [uncultured Alistipes sp.]|uniref:AsmA-like C-terminal region-containing protein n=1 Tax=uncultured Alistipes sp. TaxID=538949 RepID=UPI00280521C4|nr:AsmA-like C-terminal region-containing protein [uncultured Alistipes sp.]